MFVMNSLAVFRFPLKVGHDPKRFVGCDAVAIVGGPEGGLGGGGSGLRSGVLGGSTSIGSPLFSGSLLGLCPNNNHNTKRRVRRRG